MSDFERIFRSNYDAVYRYAARRVTNDAVQDVVSETFLNAWRRFDDLRGDPLPWLLGIARRVSANQRRGGERRAALLQRIAYEAHLTGPAPGRDDDLLAALASLSEPDREVLLLVAWEGLSNGDAARVVGCSTAAFAVRLHRARGRLRRALRSNPESTVALANEMKVVP